MHYSETAYDQLHAKTMKILHLNVSQRACLAEWLRSLTHDHHTHQKKFTGFQAWDLTGSSAYFTPR